MVEDWSDFKFPLWKGNAMTTASPQTDRVFWFVTLIAVGLMLPARGAEPPELDAQPIDLTAFYGKVSGTEGDSWFKHPDWVGVPKGLQNFGGILFDVSGTMLLRSREMPHLKERQAGIPVGGKFRYVHILHGIGYADPDGTEVARLELHFGDGETHNFPIVYGTHVRDWWRWPSEAVSSVSHEGSAVAWSGPHPQSPQLTLRLFRTTFENPRPEVAIDRIDLVSMNQRSVLCIVGLSVGNERTARSEEKAEP
jgi:hypothetical protein